MEFLNKFNLTEDNSTVNTVNLSIIITVYTKDRKFVNNYGILSIHGKITVFTLYAAKYRLFVNNNYRILTVNTKNIVNLSTFTVC